MQYWESVRSSLKALQIDGGDLALLGAMLLRYGFYIYCSYIILTAWPTMGAENRWLVVAGIAVWWLGRSVEDAAKTVANAINTLASEVRNKR